MVVRDESKQAIEAVVDDFRRILDDDKTIEDGERIRLADAFYVYRLLLRRHPDLVAELPIFPTNRMLMSQVDGFRFWFNSSDREMGVLMALGMYEPLTTALVRRLVKSGMRCLDIGAQTGYYTCLMASLVGNDGRTFAFEPSSASFEILNRNVAENRFEARVTAFPVAVSSHARSIEGGLAGRMFIAGTLVQ